MREVDARLEELAGLRAPFGELGAVPARPQHLLTPAATAGGAGAAAAAEGGDDEGAPRGARPGAAPRKKGERPGERRAAEAARQQGNANLGELKQARAEREHL